MINWQLKDFLDNQGIKNPCQLQRLLETSLGLKISRTALAKLINNQPSQLRLETVQTLCTLFQVSLEDFLTITPEPPIKVQGEPHQPYGKKPLPQTELMVDPGDYL